MNANTQKLQLTDQQRKLIEDNYYEIKGKLKSLLKSLGKKSLRKINIDINTVIDGMAYSVEAALKFDPSITPIENFSGYASYICFYRLLDQFRKADRHAFIDNVKAKLVDKFTEESKQKFGYIDTKYITDNIRKNNLIISDCLGNNYRPKNLDLFYSYEDSRQKDLSFKLAENEEKFKFLKSKSDIYFTNKENKVSRLRKILVDEYILPKLMHQEYKNLTQIAKEHDITVGRLCQLLRDENIKNFLTIYYKEIDRYGVPITN